MDQILSKFDYERTNVPLFIHPPPKYVTENETNKFYEKSKNYWSNVPPTIQGILGGYDYVSPSDIHASHIFLQSLKKLGKSTALDCGAGIGRVTKNLLSTLFYTVDLVEQDFKFAKKIQETLPHYTNSVGIIYNMSLQDFSPKKQKYDLIWCQWVLEYLTKFDLFEFLKRARVGLKAGGYFVLKENVAPGKKELNKDDSSYTRPLKEYEKLLQKAGYHIVKVSQQTDYPDNLYPVYMIACQSNQVEE